MILVSEVCLVICTWHSPRFLRRIAAYLLTRADVVDVSRQESERRMKFWLTQCALEADPETAEHQARVTQFSRVEVKGS
jgi:hypothetical protein